MWHNNRIELLNRLLELKFKVVFSCVKRPWFTDEWLGTELSTSTVRELVEIGQRTGLDICGEQGEYHTLVVDGPQFRRSIQIESYSKHEEGSVMYIALKNLKLTEKGQ